MRIALVADTFPPLRTSGAVQLRDLAREFVHQGHEITVILPSPGLGRPWLLAESDGVEVLRLNSPVTKDISYLKRAIAETLMPYAMLTNLWRSPLARKRWEGVVWYSPSIFIAPVARVIKRQSDCRGYLILRDIFPQWAVDMALMGRSLPYHFFKYVESCQYAIADTIGIQAPGNAAYFRNRQDGSGQRLEVLQNWLANTPDTGCSLRVANTSLAGRKIFVYTGNMGPAQGMDVLLELAERLRGRKDLGFLFVGRGSETGRLRRWVQQRQLDNVLFHDEIPPEEIPGLYAQCHVGLISLDPRHRTHNVPGKFLTYLQGGLPVLASINPGNDLAELIETENVGQVCTDSCVETLLARADGVLNRDVGDAGVSARCRALYRRLFTPEIAVAQIVDSLAGSTSSD